MEQTMRELQETVEALCAKVRSSILENKAEEARHYAEALSETCQAIEYLAEAIETAS